MHRILFVCLGNICRSPAAEAVLRHAALTSGWDSELLLIDSAGTGDWHLGALPDARMRRAGSLRGLTLDHRARLFSESDFGQFDQIITMDDSNYNNVVKLAPSPEARLKVVRFVSFCQHFTLGEVPDPYHGSDADFDHVLDILADGCSCILARLATSAP